jgi:hypothetical protein
MRRVTTSTVRTPESTETTHVGVVTGVIDVRAARDRSLRESVCPPMCVIVLPIDGDPSIAITVVRLAARPALIGATYIDVGPESIRDVHGLSFGV